jgi:predicted outer membrane repeat protein
MAALLILSGLRAEAATLRVPEDYPGIQAAVAAAVDGDTVLVSGGLFTGAVVIGAKNIELTSVNGPEATELDGFGQSNLIQLIDSTSHVHGFTVTFGQANAGGGIFVSGGAPTIDDMVLTGNSATFGGAIYITGSQAVVRHNRITNNRGGEGGGIAIDQSDAVVSDNDIEENGGGYAGGGIYVSGGASTIVRNVIRGNGTTAQKVGEGGGIFAYGFTGPGTLLVADNLIVGNAAYDGGGIEVFADKHGKSRWINNTIADNTAIGVGPQAYARDLGRGIVFANNVFAGAGDTALYCWFDGHVPPVFDHNDVYPGADGACSQAAVTGTNLTLPPGFTSGSNGHPYHLAPDSPLVDAGNDEAVRHLHHDLGMRPRIVDGGHGLIVDIGAYEYQPE